MTTQKLINPDLCIEFQVAVEKIGAEVTNIRILTKARLMIMDIKCEGHMLEEIGHLAVMTHVKSSMLQTAYLGTVGFKQLELKERLKSLLAKTIQLNNKAHNDYLLHTNRFINDPYASKAAADFSCGKNHAYNDMARRIKKVYNYLTSK